MKEIKVDVVELKAQYPVGPEVPVITLTNLDQVEAMIRSLGLWDFWRRDAVAYADLIAKKGKSSMVVYYETTKDKSPHHVYVVLCLSCFKAEELDIAAAFVFHEKEACKLAFKFADELFKASEANLKALPGPELYVERND